ncbi:MAG: hypothetical protein ACI9F9_002613, partial [Candidatus Paceibacteria bacterium]
MGHARSAGASPKSVEVEKDHFAFVIREIELEAIDSLAS